MRSKNPTRPTFDEMQDAIRALGQTLRQPGDLTERVIDRCASALGISFRMARSYWYAQPSQLDPVHFREIRRLTTEQEAPRNELQELRDRLDRLERAVLQERARDNRAASRQGRSWSGGLGPLDRPLAG